MALKNFLAESKRASWQGRILRQTHEEPHRIQTFLFNHPPDPMITHVCALGVDMVLVVAREGNCGLVVGEHGGGLGDGTKDLGEKAPQPEGLLYPVCGRKVLTL